MKKKYSKPLSSLQASARQGPVPHIPRVLRQQFGNNSFRLAPVESCSRRGIHTSRARLAEKKKKRCRVLYLILSAGGPTMHIPAFSVHRKGGSSKKENHRRTKVDEHLYGSLVNPSTTTRLLCILLHSQLAVKPSHWSLRTTCHRAAASDITSHSLTPIQPLLLSSGAVISSESPPTRAKSVSRKSASSPWAVGSNIFRTSMRTLVEKMCVNRES